MDFRIRRQLLVFAVIVFFIAGIGFLVYSVWAPPSTCSDNRRNQGEEEVDCGGPCSPCIFKLKKDLEVFWTRAVKVRGNAYDVAAEIYNPNTKLGAVSFEYEFTLVDNAGLAVASRQGKAFIYPRETMHVIEVGLIARRAIRDASITIRSVEWVLTERIAPDIVSGSREYRIEEDDGESPRSVAQAIVTNRTLDDLSSVVVGALLLDGQGNLIGVHSTLLPELRAGGSQPVTFIWPEAVPTRVNTIIVEARSRQALLDAPRP